MAKTKDSHLLSTVGVRTAESTTHEYGRIIVMLMLIGILIWNIYNEIEETNDIDDLNEFIKKDTIIYNSLIELEPVYRARYIKSLKTMLCDDSKSFYSKYYHTILVALITGLGSEYIISGNVAKPMSGIARTIIYNTWSTIIS